MVGLVNAAGTSEFSRVQSELSAAARTRSVERSEWSPLMGEADEPESVLDTAVQRLEFTTAGAERHLPEGEESDRFDQADQESHSTAALGDQLDVTA